MIKTPLHEVDDIQIELMEDNITVRASRIGLRQYEALKRVASDMQGDWFDMKICNEAAMHELPHNCMLKKIILTTANTPAADLLISIFDGVTWQLVGGYGTVERVDGNCAKTYVYIDPEKDDEFCNVPNDSEYYIKQFLPRVNDGRNSTYVLHMNVQHLNWLHHHSTFAKICPAFEPYYVTPDGKLGVRKNTIMDTLKTWKYTLDKLSSLRQFVHA